LVVQSRSGSNVKGQSTGVLKGSLGGALILECGHMFIPLILTANSATICWQIELGGLVQWYHSLSREAGQGTQVSNPALRKGRGDPLIPCHQKRSHMYYVYLLQSGKDHGFYVGFTASLEQRLSDHEDGRVKSTKNRRPIKRIYFEAYSDEDLARKREQKLKQFGSAYTALLKRLDLK